MSDDFVKLVEREESPLFVSLISLGFTRSYFLCALDWDVTVARHRYERGAHLISKDDASVLRTLIAGRLMDYKNFVPAFVERCLVQGANLLSTAAEIKSRGAEREPLRLLESFRKFTEATKQMVPFLVAVVIVERSLEPIIMENLSAEAPGADAARLLRNLLAPKYPPAVVEDIRSMFGLALKVASQERLKRLVVELTVPEALEVIRAEFPLLTQELEEHSAKYGWLRTHGYRFSPMTMAEAVQRLKSIVIRWDADQISAVFNKVDVFDLETELGFTPSVRLSDLADSLRELVSLRFYRMDVHLEAFCEIKPLMRAISEYCGTTEEEIVFATEPEIISALDGSGPLVREELQRRLKNHFWVIRENDNLSAGAYTDSENEISKGSEVETGIIKGISASSGFARGVCKVVLGAEQMDKVDFGDILVTTMTTPDLMLAIEKAAAIITDEGGILSHAAIITRELGIPAVIATESATRRLSDGMFVDVDATGVDGIVSFLT